VLSRPSFSISEHKKLDLGDGTFLEWKTMATI